MYKYRQLAAEQKTEGVQQRLARGYPPHSPPHPVRDRPYYLLTAACYEHQAHMAQAERRQVVLDMLLNVFTTIRLNIIMLTLPMTGLKAASIGIWPTLAVTGCVSYGPVIL